MILEVAILNVVKGKESEFEQSFSKAQGIISSIDGYISHQLQKCIDVEHRYILLVHWQNIESHTVNFRKSTVYHEWKTMLHHFYDPFPVVEHYHLVDTS